MTDTINNIPNLIQVQACCDLASVRIADFQERERQFFSDFMPEAVTAIVLLHHVTTEEEWTWYATGDGGEHCGADDHVKDLCLTIKDNLAQEGYDAELVKYPKESGLQFRYLAEAAGLGSIGTNAFLFHPAWGPWVHLRAMGTTAELDLRPKLTGDQFCNQCDLCISECPAQAISDNSFQGLQCRSYRMARGEYDPQGPDGLLPYCKRCIWICPIGKQPVPRVGNQRIEA